MVLVDAGGSNLGSVRHALARLGIDAELTRDAARIRAATHVILPGVGAAGPGMARLQACDLVDVLCSLEQPVLGICLGMHLLFEHSEEGDIACLGVIRGRVRRLAEPRGCRVRHIGWNQLLALRDDPLVRGLADPVHAYFVHSYAAAVDTHTLAKAEHGMPFAAVVRERNFVGMQFHPERSGSVGAALLARFLA